MIRFSEVAGLVAGVALFLGTLLAAQGYVSQHGEQQAELELVLLD